MACPPAPRAYRGHARAATRPTSPEPRGQAGTETAWSHNHPRGHTRHPERVATGAQARPRAAQWARRPRRQQERRAQTRPAEGPGPAPGNHPPPLAPARVQARVGAAGREARVSPLPRAKAAPALQTHGLEAPACTTGAATRGASQLGGRPEARPLGLARGLGHMGSTRPDPRGRGTLPGQACGDQEPHSLGRRGRVPGSTASSRPSRPPACPHGKAAATSRTAPGPGARPHPRPPAQPGPAPHEAPHIAHLTDDGLLLLAQVTLAAVRELPLQVLVHLQDLRAMGLRVRGLETCRAGRPPSLCPFPSPQ